MSAQENKMTFAGIVLTGGRSSRMGTPKAGLLLEGRTFLEWQLEKFKALGIKEIIVSGASDFDEFSSSSGAKVKIINDIYPARGPLGGLHACLREIKAPSALVLPVDVPLVPTQILHMLLDVHRENESKNKADVTALTVDGNIQPLIAVYSASLALDIEPMIREKGRPVRALLDRCRVATVEYSGPRCMVQNCNTPEEYRALLELIKL